MGVSEKGGYAPPIYGQFSSENQSKLAGFTNKTKPNGTWTWGWTEKKEPVGGFLHADFYVYPSISQQNTHTHTNHEVNTTHNTTMNHESLAKQTTDITSDITKSTIPQRKFLDSQKASSSDSSRREAVSSSPVTADLWIEMMRNRVFGVWRYQNGQVGFPLSVNMYVYLFDRFSLPKKVHSNVCAIMLKFLLYRFFLSCNSGWTKRNVGIRLGSAVPVISGLHNHSCRGYTPTFGGSHFIHSHTMLYPPVNWPKIILWLWPLQKIEIHILSNKPQQPDSPIPKLLVDHSGLFLSPDIFWKHDPHENANHGSFAFILPMWKNTHLVGSEKKSPHISGRLLVAFVLGAIVLGTWVCTWNTCRKKKHKDFMVQRLEESKLG